MNNNLRTIFIAEQTTLVNCLLATDFTMMEIENNYDEENDCYNDIHIWWLINPGFVDVIQELELPITDFKGQYWFGQTWYGAAIQHSHVYPLLQSRLPFLREDMVIEDDDSDFDDLE